jgi:hypothetical protein
LRSAEIEIARRITAGRIALQLDVAEFPRRAHLDAVAQAEELLLALGRRRSGRAFKLVHRVGRDGAGDGGLVIRHREQHDHPVEVVLLQVALGERLLTPKNMDDFTKAQPLLRKSYEGS